MLREVTITTGARLHFGLLAHGAAAGSRQFGGAGLMIDAPGVRLTVQRDERDGVTGRDEDRRRGEQFVQLYRARCPADRWPPPCRIDIHAALPSHAGLGSGTQLGLAMAQGLALLAGEGTAGPAELARRVGRGLRSALGIHGFQRGGFLVEGGKLWPETISPLVARADFPAEWRIVLISPPDERGLAGADERRAFAALPPMPAATTDRLCRLVLMDLLPAVLEADFPACGEALYEFGRLVGESFAPVQGGTYASPTMAALVTHLRRSGVRGVGQSSWGPTLFALAPDATTARQLTTDLQTDPRWATCHFLTAAPLNTGAALQIVP